MAETYSLVAKITADIKDFTSKFKQVEETTSSLKNRTEKFSKLNPFSNFLGAGLAVNAISSVTSKVSEGAKGLFDYAGTVEQMKIGWDAIAKQDAAGIMDNINKVAAKTPYEIADIDTAYKSLYNSGIKTADLEKTFTTLGDAASGVGAPVDQVTRAFSQMQAKGKVTGGEMLQLSEAGIPAWKLLADAMGLSVAEVQSLSEKGKLGGDSLQLLLGSMEKSFGGGMQKQAQSFNGLMSTLSDTVKQVLTPAFSVLQEKMKPGLEWVINTLPQLTTIASSISFDGVSEQFAIQIANIQSAIDIIDFSQIGTNFTMIFTNMAPAVTPVIDLMSVLGAITFVGLASSVDMIFSVLGDVSGLMATMVSQFSGGFWEGLGLDDAAPLVESVRNAFANLSEAFFLIASNESVVSFFGSIGDILGVIVGSIVTGAIKAFESLTEAFVNISVLGSVDLVFQAIAATAEVLKNAVAFLKPGFDAIVDVFSLIVSNKAVADIFTALAISIGIVVGAMKAWSLAQTAWAKATMFANGVMLLFNAAMAMNPVYLIIIAIIALIAVIILVVTHFEEVKNAVLSFLSPVIGFFTMLWTQVSTVFGQIASVVMGVFGQISTIVTEVFNVIVGIIQTYINIWLTIFGVLFTALETVWNVLVTIVTAVFNVVVGVVQTYINIWISIFTLAFDIVKTIVTVAFTLISAVVQIAFAGFKALWETLSAVFKVIFDSVVNVVKTAFGFVSAIAKGVWDGLTAVWNGLVGFYTPIFQTVGNIFKSVFDGISSAASNVWNGIVYVWNAASGFFSNLFNGISNIASNVWNGISNTISNVFNGVRNAWNGLSSFAGNVTDGIANAFSQVAQTIRNVINQPIGGLNGAIGIINKIPGVSVPQIPYLYRGTDDWQGGFARMNEGGRGELVNLPNGAQVIPHDISRVYAKESARVHQQGTGSQQQEVVVNVVVENRGDVNIDSKKVADVVWREVEKNIEKNQFGKRGAFL